MKAGLPALALLPVFSLSLASCAVGPNYVRPTTPGGPPPAAFVDPGTTKVSSDPAEPQWWRLFRDPVLDRLVLDALRYNTDVRQAAANLKLARATLQEAHAGRLPTTGLTASYTRERIGAQEAGSSRSSVGGAGTGGPSGYEFNFYTAGLDASYEVDLFGRVSRSIEAARADAAAAQAALDGARVSIAAETARTYAQVCSYAAQAAVARETARLQDQTLQVTRRLGDAGRGTLRDVDQAVVLAESARAQIPTFEGERRASLYALAVLTGRQPAQLDADAGRCVSPPGVTSPIPVGDGAALLARRPDVRQAERKLAAETARIGIQTAALYPSIKLLGAVSLGALDIGDIGKSSALNYSAGPMISWSFPNIAVARARIRQSRASAEVALAAFDGTVLTALREVEQALARYAAALDADAAQRRSAAAASNAASLTELRFNAGRDSFLQRLVAERDRASARSALANADANLAEAQVALFKALGGGWEGAPAPERRQ